MIVNQTYRKLNPDTVNGFGVQVITTIYSFDEREIEKIAESLQEAIGSGVVSEVTTNE